MKKINKLFKKYKQHYGRCAQDKYLESIVKVAFKKAGMYKFKLGDEVSYSPKGRCSSKYIIYTEEEIDYKQGYEEITIIIRKNYDK